VQELAEESAAEGGLVKCSRFLFNDFFSDHAKSEHPLDSLERSSPDCRVGRTVVIDERSEVIFFDPKPHS